MQKYDVVIIGSGLGGLLCGYILSKEGYKICIIEKNRKIGGCLQTFVRNGTIFDVGMHYIGSLDEGQIMYRFFKYFDLIGKLKLSKLNEDAFDILTFRGKVFKYAQGHNNFIETLSESFPAERQALINYIEKFKEIHSSLNIYNLREVEINNIIQDEYVKVRAFDYIRSITSDNTLQNVLAGSNALYAGVREKTPLYVHAVINNFFIESAWRLVDGGDQIPHYLAESIKENGGSIITGTKVEKFSFDDKKISSAKLDNGEFIHSKYFISNIHPANTIKMIPPDKLREVYRKRVLSLENTIGVFSLYIVLKENSFPYLNYNNYYYETDSVWGTSVYSSKSWPEGYMMYTPASSKSEKWAENIIAITYMKYEELLEWENTTVEKRGNSYLEFKNNKAEKFISLLEKNFPGLRQKIKAFYTSTPLTYRDYIGTPEGSTYGILKDCNKPMHSYITPKTKIPNLFFTGQNINLHGILGVTIGSLLTCAEFVGMNYLIRKINFAN